MEATNEPQLNLLSALEIMGRRYGVEMNTDDFLEEAYLAFKDINSTPAKTYYFTEKPASKDDLTITLPCNLYNIISVTTAPMNGDDFEKLEPYLKRRRMTNIEFKNVIRGNSDLKEYHLNNQPKVGLGTYIEYEWVGDDTIRVFDERLADVEIHVIYDGIEVDDEGFPLINRKTAAAIAAKVALVFMTRKAFSGDPNAINMLGMLKPEVDRLMQAAAIPEKLTENELDSILNARTSFDRKLPNRSFKFRK